MLHIVFVTHQVHRAYALHHSRCKLPRTLGRRGRSPELLENRQPAPAGEPGSLAVSISMNGPRDQTKTIVVAGGQGATH